MKKIAVMADSNCGMRKDEAEALGCYLLPMPVYVNDILYYENATITRDEFFEYQAQGAEIKTSQPIMGDLLEAWDALLEEYEEVVYIPMSSGLSGSCASAIMAAQDYEGRVHVVDNQRISVPQAQAVKDALALAKEGKSGAQIKEYLLETKADSSIYITVDTLTYLKKGGRITPAAAAFGTVLNIKPVLTIQGDKLDAFTKVRGMKIAKKRMIEALEADRSTRFADVPADKLQLQAAYTCTEEEALEWKSQLEAHFGLTCDMSALPLSIACHTGPGAVGAAFTRRYE